MGLFDRPAVHFTGTGQIPSGKHPGGIKRRSVKYQCFQSVERRRRFTVYLTNVLLRKFNHPASVASNQPSDVGSSVFATKPSLNRMSVPTCMACAAALLWCAKCVGPKGSGFAAVFVVDRSFPREFVKTFLRRAADETNKSCHDAILGLQWQTPETRCAHPCCIEFVNEGANDAQASLFSRSPRDWFHGCVCLVTHCAHAFPSRRRWVNQSDRYDVELQRHASD
jgi:hypothetical protein